jgi:uncharacterized membrane protein YcaP (DUF421 family)
MFSGAELEPWPVPGIACKIRPVSGNSIYERKTTGEVKTMSVSLIIILKAVAIFVTLLVLTRFLGKKQISQFTFFDYVTSITIGVIAALGVVKPQLPLFYPLLGLVTFTVLSLIVGYATLEHRPLRKLINGEATVVIHNGKILEGNMARMRYHVDDLTEQLRQKGVFRISDVEFAILERRGELSVLKKSQVQPVSRADLGLSTSYEGVPAELIVDGRIIPENLKQNHLDEQWLHQKLEQMGIGSVDQVVYAQLQTDGNLYVDLKHDQLTNKTDISD